MTRVASGSVLHLFLKRAKGARPEPQRFLPFSRAGLAGSQRYSPLRQVLITAAGDLAGLGYRPGELHENIVLDFPRLHDLVSGCVLVIGAALIQLTFHCEPCRIIRKPGESLKPLVHRRGVLGKFLNAGTIEIGDPVSVTSGREEFIPYDSRERIAWFLSKQTSPVGAAALLHAVGLPSGYARALPAILRKLPSIPGERVVFASKRTARSR